MSRLPGIFLIIGLSVVLVFGAACAQTAGRSHELPSQTDGVNGISEIDYESSGSMILCTTRVILHGDGSAVRYSAGCDTPSAFCKVERGTMAGAEFERLTELIETSKFFAFDPEYLKNPDGSVTMDAGSEKLRITQNGRTHEVTSYYNNGPIQLWAILRVIAATSSEIDWRTAPGLPACPQWDDAKHQTGKS